MKLFMIRHGQSQHNIGHVPDDLLSCLTEKGQQQAKTTGEYLAKHNKPKFDLVITSGLCRTQQTADIIIPELNYKGEILHLDLFNELGPKNLTEYLKKGAEKMTKDFMEKHKNDPIGYQCNFEKTIKAMDKRFKVKETVQHDHKKVLKMIDYLQDLNAKKVLLVAHNGVILDITTELLDLPFQVIPKGYGQKPTGNCSITVFDYDKKDCIWTMLVPTSTSHLDE